MKLSEQDKMQLGLKLVRRGIVVNLQPCRLSNYHQPGLIKQQLKKINKLAKGTIKYSYKFFAYIVPLHTKSFNEI
jgi:hypothetical protein